MKRAEQKAETRERVLQAARAWFVERGFDATTIRDVAATAHVSVGTVHAHFVDKPALLRACLYDDIARAVARVWSSMDDEAPLLDQLTHCATVLYQSYAAHPELSRCMFAATLFPSPKDEPDELLRSFMAGIAVLYERAAARGEVALAAGEAARSAELFFSLYVSVLIWGLGNAHGSKAGARRRAVSWARKFRELLELQLRGVTRC